MDMLKRSLELLSAYLDGEVTAAERQQVEGWLEMIQKSKIICATVEATPKLASAASATSRTTGGTDDGTGV